MKRFALPLLAAVLGIAAFLALAPGIHPATALGFTIDRNEAIARARQTAVAMGIDAQQWKAVASVEVDNRLTYYLHEHPEDPAAPLLSGATVKVALLDPGSARRATVTLGSHGGFEEWERRQEASGPARMTIESRFLAERTMRMLAGEAAPRFRLVTDGAEGADGVRFGWELPPRSSDQITLQCKVIVRDGIIVSAGLTPELSAAWKADYDGRFGGISVPAAVYGFSISLGVVGALLFYLWCSLRRPLRHSFVFAFALAGLVLYAAGYGLGGGWASAVADSDRDSRNVSGDSIWVVAITSLGTIALYAAIAGAGLSASGASASHWRSTVDVFGRRVPSRGTGASFLAGLLTGPMVAAVPLLLVAAGIFRDPRLVIYDATGLLSPSPLLSVFNQFPTGPALLLLFGFLLPLVEKVRPKALRLGIWLLYGSVFCAGMLGSKLRPPALDAVAGTLVFLVLWRLYLKFDIIALLGAGITSAFCQQAAMLYLQPSASLRSEGTPIVECGGFLVLAAAALAWKGREVSSVESVAPEPVDESTERDRLMADFSVAHRAQQEMLPSSPPNFPGYSLAASCTPAREVGGDLFDFLKLSDGRLGISVADVSGKGVPAALYMTLTKGLLTATTQDSTDLPRILDQVNTHLHAAGKRKIFVTMAMGFLDLENRVIEYARAGHNPVVWRRPVEDETRLLASGGMGLGITGGKAFARALRVDRMQLNTGDALVFYSDGLTEAMNVELEQYGEERLMAAVAESDGQDARSTHDHILRKVREFLAGEHPQDDLTLVVLRVEEQMQLAAE